jgi:plasmid stability protein
MPELHVRNFPLELHEQLREKAAVDGRSMSSEAVVLLRLALQGNRASASKLKAIERLREIRNRSVLPLGAPSAEDLVREDRDTVL